MNKRFSLLGTAVCLSMPVWLLAGCSGGGSSSALTGQGGFQLVQANVMNNEVWAINRPLTFTFNSAVDFGTVSMNTVNVQTEAGQPAVGTFTTGVLGDGSPDTKTVVFQPTCPTLADLSDSGLESGGIPYVVTVRGLTGGTDNVVRSSTGQALATTQTRTFTTPVALDPTQAFIDTVSGPPIPIIRTVGSMTTEASYLEIGGSERIYFEFDGTTGEYDLSTPGFEIPLNLYSDAASAVAVVLEFNQALDPSASNISSENLRVEVFSAGLWAPVETEVELVANCSVTGASVRLQPRGILPPGDGTGLPNFRVAIRAGFQDVVGDGNLIDVNDFGEAATRSIDFSSLTPSEDDADEIFEDFQLAGTTFGSLEDTDVLFDAPQAIWGDGTLTSAFEFEGTGGPAGTFDWVIGSSNPDAPVASLFFNTTSQQISGGPGGVPTAIQNASNGVLNVRNLTIEANATVTALGPNPLIINATGDVIIRGLLQIDGTNAKDVATLNSGTIPEQGGAGQAGGGRGGDASTNVTGSTPGGTQGTGPFNSANAGGFGGESQFAPPSSGKQARRPGGGGGGAHSLPQLEGPESFPFESITGPGDTVTDAEDPNQGLVARQGLLGTPGGTGAITNTPQAQGGLPGPLIFADDSDENNFFGIRAVTVGGNTELIRGEIVDLVPGSGGGGGGDAIPASVFPAPNWGPSTPEKGAGGGGGAGALRIRALGRIIITGQVSANGGSGGVGENVIFLDHIGGGGGGGSGGHIVLESASKVYLGTDPTIAGELLTARDVVIAEGGRSNFGDFDLAVSVNRSIGGCGGPGLIQIHVPNPQLAPSGNENLSDVVLAPGAANQLTVMSRPEAVVLVPTFSKRSIARSKWLSTGSADIDPTTGGLNPIDFLFAGSDVGLDPDVLEVGEGVILTDASGIAGNVDVRPVTPILGVGGLLLIDGTNATVANGNELVLSGTALDDILVGNPANDVYLRTPSLVRGFGMNVVRDDGLASQIDFTFEVAAADYDDATGVFTMDVSGGPVTLQSVLDLPGTMTVGFELIPRFFRVSSAGAVDTFSEAAEVKILFQATGAAADGSPDADNVLVDWTGDVSSFGGLPAGQLKFFRFQVEFDLDAVSAGLTAATQKVSLDFLRIPFRF